LPIRWRLTLYIALVIGAILVVLGLALYFLSRSALLANVEDTTQSRAVSAARTVESGELLSGDDVEQLTLDGVSVIVRDGSGEAIQKANFPASGEANDPVWREAVRSGKAASGTAVLSGDDPYYIYAVPVDPLGGPERVVEAASPYEPAQDTLEVLGTVLVAGIGAALLLSIGGAYFLAGAALRPIERRHGRRQRDGRGRPLEAAARGRSRGRGRASRHHDKRPSLAPRGRLRPQGRSP
jgi:two-component system, OmpR family, sensor kinase